jgi:hypothetical protein
VTQDNLENLKATLLSNALSATSHILSSNHPDKALQAIQTHVLLAQYFFIYDRKLEGRYNLTMAVSLIISTRMHRIRSQEDSTRPNLEPTGFILPPDVALQRDPRKEKEMIDAFWTVLSINSCRSALEGTASSLAYWRPQMRVDTPWPGVSMHLLKLDDVQAS